MREFYYLRQSRRPDVIDERLRIIAEAVALTDDPAILEACSLHVKALVKQFNALRASIDKFDREISTLLDSHNDAAIFKSFPGAGPNLASRLLVSFGTDRSRFQSANDAQNFTGISPVLRQSGNMRVVLRRQACPAFIRHCPLLQQMPVAKRHRRARQRRDKFFLSG